MFTQRISIAAIASIGLTLCAASRAAPQVTQLWLIDTQTNARLLALSDYQTLQLPVLPSGLSIEAVSNGETESVRLRIGAAAPRIENQTPYALGGDNGGKFVPVPALRTPGWITVTAQPFSANAAAGVAGSTATAHLYINQPDFFVTDTRDVSDASLGDGVCSTSPGVRITAGQLATLQQLSLIYSQFGNAAIFNDVIATLLDRYRGGCTLRAAIEEANAMSGSQSILVDGTRGTYALSEGRLTITTPMTVTGHEMPLIDAQRRVETGVFRIDGRGDDIIVNLHGLEITGGSMTFERGGGLQIDNNAYVQLSDSVIRDNQANYGGGIYLEGGADLHMQRTVLRNNKAGDPVSFGGGGQTQRGGGIFNRGGVVTIEDSAIFDNSAVRGGGVSNFGGTMYINNSSIIDNQAASIGGGIENHANFGVQGNLHLNFATVAHNKAGVSTADPANLRIGGGIYNTSWAYMANSILAKNTDFYTSRNTRDPNHAPDCFSPTLYNFKSYRENTVGVLNAQCSLTDYGWGTTAWIDFGTAAAPLDPQFTSRSTWGELAYYNLTPSSPGLDEAATATASLFPCPTHDMRDRPRPAGAGCDRGAIERQ